MLRALIFAVLVACGGNSPKKQLESAQAALASGDWAAASTAATAGLSAGAEGATAWRLELVGLEAQARGKQGAEALATIERLAGAYSSQVKAALYLQTATQLTEAGDGAGAISVLDAGLKRFPDDEGLKKAIDQAKLAGDDASMQQLRTLGYVE